MTPNFSSYAFFSSDSSITDMLAIRSSTWSMAVDMSWFSFCRLRGFRLENLVAGQAREGSSRQEALLFSRSSTSAMIDGQTQRGVDRGEEASSSAR